MNKENSIAWQRLVAFMAERRKDRASRDTSPLLARSSNGVTASGHDFARARNGSNGPLIGPSRGG